MTPLDQIEILDEQDQIEAALDLLFAWVDDQLHAGTFGVVDDMLDHVNVWRLKNISILLGFLTITLAAKTKLKRRVALVRLVEMRLSDDSRRDSLLRGLR